MEEIIKAYLDDFAAKDPIFAMSYPSESKTIEGCCRYIYKHYEEEARNANHARCLAVKDDDVFGLAVHYFEEESIKETKDEPAAKVKVAAPAKVITPVKKPAKSANKPEQLQLSLF